MAVSAPVGSAHRVRCSVIIATLDRIASLAVVLDCLERQSHLPHEIIISAAGDLSGFAADLLARPANLRVQIVASPVKSAALQRNQAAALATGDVLAFLDDDIEFAPELFADMLVHFSGRHEHEIGALSPRIANTGRDVPGRLTRWYYALQSGYVDADYGGRLFGPGINCFPVFSPSGPPLVRSDWLPSTCLFMRASTFRRHLFPQFTGYSFAEDVHLTARIARELPVYFLREPSIIHHSLPSEFKSNRAALAAGKFHNMAVVAREAMGLDGWSLWWRWQLHRLFVSAVLLVRRPAQWTAELRGVWQANP